MLNGIILITIILGVLIFFVVYKRRMLIQMFSLNISHLSREFQGQIEGTADHVIKRMQHQIDQMEFLLDEATQKIEVLGDQINAAENLIRSMNFSSQEVSGMTLAHRDHLEEKAILLSEDDVAVRDAGLNPAEKAASDADKRQKALEMAGQGCSITDIAKATSMGQGEVMLFLQLNKK